MTDQGANGRRLGRRAMLAVAVVAIVGFAGSARAQVKLQFWDMIWGPPEYIDTAKKIVGDFNASHPDIQVEYRSVPWSNWYQTFVTAISAGNAPDVSTGAGYQAVQLYDMGAIRPVDDIVADIRAGGGDKDFLPGSIDTLRYDGHYVAVPWAVDIRVWYYRTDLLKAANVAVPAIFAEFRAAAKALTGNGHYGVIASGDTGGTHYIYSALLNNGGGLFSKDRSIDIDSARDTEALDWLAGMVADKSVHPASAGYSSDDKRSAFFQGQGEFILDNPGLLGIAGASAKDIAVLPPLAGPHGDKGTISWVNNIMMYQQTKHPQEAKTFLEWWSQNELPLWTEGHATQIPARLSFARQSVEAQPDYKFIVENYVPVGRTTAFAAPGIFPTLSQIEGEGVMQTMVQRMLQGAPIKDVTSQAKSRLQEILQN